MEAEEIQRRTALIRRPMSLFYLADLTRALLCLLCQSVDVSSWFHYRHAGVGPVGLICECIRWMLREHAQCAVDALPDASGNLYIAESLNHRVIFIPAGSFTPTRVSVRAASPAVMQTEAALPVLSH